MQRKSLETVYFKYYNERVDDKDKEAKRIDEHGSKSSLFLYLAYFLNSIGVVLIMLKDVLDN